jgi:SAM-dependent methyltransferase
LEVVLCSNCSLVQLVDVIDPEVLFSSYLYVTGTSDTMAAHNREYAATVLALLELGSGDLVIEAASNDGSLLKEFQRLGVAVLGVEPAKNIAAGANAAGVETVNAFFSIDTARKLRAERGAAACVLANNVLAHVDTPVGFLKAAKLLLRQNGVVCVEAPYLGEFVERLEYDTIYHEHLCYFSITALMRICEEAGLRIARIDRVAVHGGSIRMYAKSLEHQGAHADDVQRAAREERTRGWTSLERFQTFARDVARQKDALLALLKRLKSEGKTLAAYGAPAKGNTLLNYCRIGPDLIPFTVDKNPLKVGLFTPGMHVPVLAATELVARRPDYCLILAWNFADEIQRQQAEYLARGGRFVLPLPEPRVL